MRVHLDFWYPAPPPKGGHRQGYFTARRSPDPPHGGAGFDQSHRGCVAGLGPPCGGGVPGPHGRLAPRGEAASRAPRGDRHALSAANPRGSAVVAPELPADLSPPRGAGPAVRAGPEQSPAVASWPLGGPAGDAAHAGGCPDPGRGGVGPAPRRPWASRRRGRGRRRICPRPRRPPRPPPPCWPRGDRTAPRAPPGSACASARCSRQENVPRGQTRAAEHCGAHAALAQGDLGGPSPRDTQGRGHPVPLAGGEPLAPGSGRPGVQARPWGAHHAAPAAARTAAHTRAEGRESAPRPSARAHRARHQPPQALPQRP
jgi:hypothetical protein